VLAEAMGVTTVVNMALVRALDVERSSDGTTAIYVVFVDGERLIVGDDDASIVLKWLRDHAARHEDLSVDVDAASWRRRGDG